MIKLIIPSLFLTLMVFIGAKTKPKTMETPIWISNPQIEYPADDYLSGVGTGITKETAEKKALSSLAQFFETTVTASTASSDQEQSATTNNESKAELKSTFASQIETFSSAKIQFAEVVKTWQNPSTQNYYVLMVIDKDKACEIYQNKITENEKLMRLYLGTSDDLLQRYANLRRASKASLESEPYYYYYNALANSQLPRLRASFSLNEIDALVNESANSIYFDLSVKGDSSDLVIAAIKETIQKMGFCYGDNDDMRLVITIVSNESKVMGKQIFAGYSATIALYYQDNQVYALREQVQQGDTNLSLAKTRAMKALSNSLSQKFKKEFNKYLEHI